MIFFLILFKKIKNKFNIKSSYQLISINIFLLINQLKWEIDLHIVPIMKEVLLEENLLLLNLINTLTESRNYLEPILSCWKKKMLFSRLNVRKLENLNRKLKWFWNKMLNFLQKIREFLNYFTKRNRNMMLSVTNSKSNPTKDSNMLPNSTTKGRNYYQRSTTLNMNLRKWNILKMHK